MAVAEAPRSSSDVAEELRGRRRQGVARATKTLRNVRSAWIKEQRVDIRDGKIPEYRSTCW